MTPPSARKPHSLVLLSALLVAPPSCLEQIAGAGLHGTTSQYSYDGDGKRVSQTVGATTTNSVYDVNAGLPVLLDDGARKYVWGLVYIVGGAGAIEVAHTDGLGSVRALTDATGAATQTQGTSSQPLGCGRGQGAFRPL